MEATRLSLLERVKRSPQDDSWQEFVAIYSPFVRGYLCRVGLSNADAEDLQQDVMQVVVQEIQKFEHNHRTGAFRTWLRRVVANRLRSFHRLEARRRRDGGGAAFERFADALCDDTSRLSHIWEREHNEHIVSHLLEMASTRFSASTINAFRKTFLDQRPLDEVAAELDMTVNAVVIARSRVLANLRELGTACSIESTPRRDRRCGHSCRVTRQRNDRGHLRSELRELNWTRVLCMIGAG